MEPGVEAGGRRGAIATELALCPGRDAERAARSLDDLIVVLLVDAYDGYARRSNVVFCWVHVRHKFSEFAQTSPVATALVTSVLWFRKRS